MPRYRYHAIDTQGQSLSGEVDGSTLGAAREALLERGLQISEIQPVAEATGALSSAEAFAVAHHISQVTRSDVPLVGSLRAFSEEVVSPSLRERLDRVCNALENGEALEKVLVDPHLKLPKSMGAILSSGLPHAAINHLLSLSVRAASTAADLQIRAAMLLVYPLIMVTCLLSFWLFLLAYVTPQFASIYADFGTEISAVLEQLIYFSSLVVKVNWYALLGLIPIFVLVWLGFQFGLAPATRQRIWCGIPIVGAMYRLTALAEFARLQAVMLETSVPLPQALLWSAMGANDADLQERTEAVIERLKAGDDPVTAGQQVAGIPAYYQQMLRFIAQGANGADPLRSMAKLLESRAKSLSQVAMPLMEPVVEIAALTSIGAYILIVFPPLIKLLNDLS